MPLKNKSDFKHPSMSDASLSVSDTATVLQFNRVMERLSLVNDGTKNVYLKFDDDGRDAGLGYPVEPDESFSHDLEFTSLTLVCSTGESTTLRYIVR